MNLLIRRGDPVRAAELFGAEEAMGERLEIPNPYREEELAEALELVGDTLTREDWERHRRTGRTERVEELLGRVSL